MADGGSPLANGELEIYTLDVGQGDARLTVTPTGETILTDADKEAVAEELTEVLEDRELKRTDDGKVRIDHFHVTHIDYDHVWGLKSLHENGYEIQHVTQPDISRFEIVDPQTEDNKDGVTEKVINNYRNHLGFHNIDVDDITQVSKGVQLSNPSDAEINVLAPPADEGIVKVTRPATGATVNFKPEQSNENGAVYKLEGERSALFMGDVQDDSHHHAESWLMQQHDNPESEIDLEADIIFASHHGSTHATSDEFLDRVDPDVAVISSGLDNKHTSENQHDAHPHDATLKRLHDRDVDVYWTAGHGTTRTNLDAETARPEPTTDLETTDAADLAALKYYCREHEIDPEAVGVLLPDNFPEETPAWAIDAAPMIADTQEQFIDEAVANAETVEDLRQTLDPTPDAHDQLRETVQADREAHVTTKQDVKRNKEAYFEAVEREQAYERLPLHTRLRANLPSRFGGIEHPLTDGPSSDEMDALPKNIEDVPKAVRNDPAAKLRVEGDFVNNWSRSLLRAETAADTAVDDAHTPRELCRHLRDTPGAHQDFLYAIDTPDAHEQNKSEKGIDDLLERTKEHERTEEQTHTQDQDFSLGL
ncbi:ComEC/Rec2 family competence protein [Halocatena pleomorpha]|uniref:MBL fold metallo-hydrolase n=1 Tax=Halocatena pleomorpha TaxID=1785090 RepID=A0A3P3R9G2_9EURY|nr:hypothetical protein [Halocatena pleomorpha]RRJ29955.1 hypothetical protein EIK79_11425 [Halocatena pleomorpha]